MTNEEKVRQFMKTYFDNVSDEQLAKDIAEIEAMNLGGIPIGDLMNFSTSQDDHDQEKLDRIADDANDRYQALARKHKERIQ